MRFSALVACLAAILASVSAPAWAGTQHRDGQAAPNHTVTGNPVAVGHDVSPPLRTIVPSPQGPQPQLPLRKVPVPQLPAVKDGALQTWLRPALAAQAPPPSVSFNGVGQGFTGPQGNFSVGVVPADPNASVGDTQVVETVNDSFAVFSKSGQAVYGPASTQTLFQGFTGGGLCPSEGKGDATVRYDALAQRWVITQFAFNVNSQNVDEAPYYLCVAVSTSSDATGSWNRYSYQSDNLPDYPKLSVWPDAYYLTANVFQAGGGSFQHAEVCALNRTAMLNGNAAPLIQCETPATSYFSLLAADVDGDSPPPSGEPEVVMALGTSNTTLAYWRFRVDWASPGNTALTGPSSLTVAAYTNLPGTSIPQPGTSQQLDTLGGRLMYRLAYRNIGGQQLLVASGSVDAGGHAGERWYEFGMSGSGLAVQQQSTYSPDATSRWMGSIAMDASGDIALGYSASSASIHPGIRYTGRDAGDPVNQMTLGETTVLDGSGSQSSNRWGDYSSMAVDPADGCTFWYTTQYLPADGVFNWRTRLAAFTLPGCSTTPPGPIPGALTYTGPVTSDYHDAFTASATLTAGGSPVAGAPVTFTLGQGLPQETCTATTSSSGQAACSLTPEEASGTTKLTAAFAGNSAVQAASDTVSFTITREEDTLTYTGQPRIANGVPASLSAVLKEDGTSPISGRQVTLAIGTGSSLQSCTATTGSDGTGSCTVTPHQPLNSTATVPATATFAGDAFYLPSSASATLLLQYMTGRAYGLSAAVNLPLLPVNVPPQPDTGTIRTADAVTTSTPCTASVSAVVLSAQALCPKVTTTIAPGSVTATSTVSRATIGIPGLPVITVTGLTGTSASTCSGATGSASLTLTIGGSPVTVPTAPNSTIPLGVGSITVNEQDPVTGADHGLTEEAFHLTALGGTVDVVLGYATSASHNCL